MRNRISTTAAAASRRLLSLILSAAVVAGCGSAAHAQSGRRIPKRPSNTEPPPPPPKDQPSEKESVSESPALTPVLIASGLYDIGSSDSAIMTRIVIEGIMERLKEAHAIKAQSVSSNVNRKEASDAAKKTADTYVLWFELRSDSTDSMQSMRNPRSLYVDYVVFMPSTGKQKTMGHVYQRTGTGPIGLPGPPSTTLGSLEYTLRWAGNETADRLLDTLELSRPPGIPR